MVAPVTAADLADMEPKLILPARYKLQHQSLAKSLVRQERLQSSQGRYLNIPKFGDLEAQDATEGVEVDNPQTITTSNVQVEPLEIVAQVLLTDRAIRTSGENQVRAAGKNLGDAMRKKLDKKGLAEYDNFVTHALGGAATTITVGHITAAVARLKGGDEPAPGPIYCVLRPEQMRVILNSIAPTGTYPIPQGVSQEVVEEYLAHDFKLFGLQGGYQSGNLDRTADANQTAKGAIFSKDATVYVPADEMDIEKERLRGWLFQASHDFAFKHYNEAWGVEMQFAAPDPTS